MIFLKSVFKYEKFISGVLPTTIIMSVCSSLSSPLWIDCHKMIFMYRLKVSCNNFVDKLTLYLTLSSGHHLKLSNIFVYEQICAKLMTQWQNGDLPSARWRPLLFAVFGWTRKSAKRTSSWSEYDFGWYIYSTWYCGFPFSLNTGRVTKHHNEQPWIFLEYSLTECVT